MMTYKQFCDAHLRLSMEIKETIDYSKQSVESHTKGYFSEYRKDLYEIFELETAKNRTEIIFWQQELDRC